MCTNGGYRSMMMLPWQCFRRRRSRCLCKCCCLCFVFATACVLATGFYFYITSLCSNEDSQILLEDLCTLYREKKVDGSFCHSLCDENSVHFDQCQNYKGGKLVIIMKCDLYDGQSRKIVLKTKRALKDREVLELLDHPENDSELSAETYEFIMSMIKTSIEENFSMNIPVSNKDNILTFLWGYDYDLFVQTNGLTGKKVALQSIWSVIEQQEYTFMRLFQDYSFTPKIYGTCGPVYFTEYTPPGDILGSEVSYDWSSDWTTRARLAIRIIQLLQMLDTGLQETLHLCDVKGGNFGINSRGEVTLVDTDSVFFESALMRQMKYSNCTQDEDCDFFDCRAVCNKEQNTCYQRRTNNNLQSVCQDVFLGPLISYRTGLLRDPPLHIRNEVWTSLEDCAFPGEMKSSRSAASTRTGVNLINVLRKSLK